MILPLVQYGDPVLRRQARAVLPGEEGLGPLIGDMLETMERHEGIGLAAPQVGRSLHLAVVDIRPASSRQSRLWLEDAPADVEEHMPMILINPEIRPLDEAREASEGCLSFPGIFGEIPRPYTIEAKTLQLEGPPLQFRCNDLLARVIQHETDHLNGILFIDRMTSRSMDLVREEIGELQRQTRRSLPA